MYDCTVLSITLNKYLQLNYAIYNNCTLNRNRILKFIVFPSGSDHGWLNYFHNIAWNIVNAIIFLWSFPAQWTILVLPFYFDILFNNNP